MTLQHTPLEVSTLSLEVRRALGPGPGKLLAARGMAPMANPGDLITLFYQLSLDPEPSIRESANKSAGELPPNILKAALEAPVDSRVLDYFAHKVASVYDLVAAVILNQATADETIAWIAERGGTREVELIATNQQRLLRFPQIIGSMYLNKRASMSTVDKAVELAVHNRVRVPGIAAWDEICSAILTSGKRDEVSPADDAEFMSAAQRGEGEMREVTDEEILEEGRKEEKKSWSERTIPEKIRLVTLGNAFHRAEGIRDPNKLVAMATVKAPGVKETEARKWASNTALLGEVISYIADKRDWVKQYAVKVALVQNPKCPLPVVTRLVPHLRDKELKFIAKSKAVSSAVSAQCKKLLAHRAHGGKK
jgi:hypothetical protein